MSKILVSACLAGEACRFDAKHSLVPEIREMVKEGIAIPGCPEVLGGLSIPRPRAEIVGGDGQAVIDNRATVMTVSELDVGAAFLDGAGKFLALARSQNCRSAVLKVNSPSCGVGHIFDGSFSGTVKSGDGVAATLLRQAGLEITACE